MLAGAPVVRGDGHLRDLPSRARYIVETIAWQEASTLQYLQQETGLTRERLEEELPYSSSRVSCSRSAEMRRSIFEPRCEKNHDMRMTRYV